MASLRTRSLLLALLALLLAMAHGQQALGRWQMHHHDRDLAQIQSAGGLGHHHEDGSTPMQHQLEQHEAAALLPGLIVSPIIVLHALADAEMPGVTAPEAPVAGIDYPPQLVG